MDWYVIKVRAEIGKNKSGGCKCLFKNTGALFSMAFPVVFFIFPTDAFRFKNNESSGSGNLTASLRPVSV